MYVYIYIYIYYDSIYILCTELPIAKDRWEKQIIFVFFHYHKLLLVNLITNRRVILRRGALQI